jgi:acetoacetyl-CoA synthetase
VPRWFPGARLNYAENLLWRTDDGIAITECNDSGNISSYSYRELREHVRKLAGALRIHGLQPGDRVAGSFRVWLHVSPDSYDQAIVANRTLSVAIALATACLGGIFTSTATDMGVKVSSFKLQAQVGRLNCAAGYSRPLWTSTAQVHFLRN